MDQFHSTPDSGANIKREINNNSVCYCTIHDTASLIQVILILFTMIKHKVRWLPLKNNKLVKAFSYTLKSLASMS